MKELYITPTETEMADLIQATRAEPIMNNVVRRMAFQISGKLKNENIISDIINEFMETKESASSEEEWDRIEKLEQKVIEKLEQD